MDIVVSWYGIQSIPNRICLDQTALLEKVDWGEVILGHWHQVSSSLASILTEGWFRGKGSFPGLATTAHSSYLAWWPHPNHMTGICDSAWWCEGQGSWSHVMTQGKGISRSSVWRLAGLQAASSDWTDCIMVLQKIVYPMPAQVLAVIEAKGGHTK